MKAKERINRWLTDARTTDDGGPRSVAGRVLRFGLLTATKFHRDLCFQRASALGFATLISLIPLAVLFFSFAGKFGGGEKIINWVRETGFQYVAPDFRQQLDEMLVQNLSKNAFDQSGTGLVNVVAIAGLLFAAFGMMATAERYVNAIWESPKRRPYLQKLMTFWVVLTVSPLFLALSLWVGESVLHKGGWLAALQERLPFVGAFVDFATPLLIAFLGFTALYIALPAARVKPLSAAVGGFAAVVLWETARRSFFVYVARQGELASLYGKLAAVPLFLVWVYLNWVIVLFGAVVGFVHQHYRQLLERERRHETTARKFSKAAVALALLKRLHAEFVAGAPPRDLADVAQEIDAPEDAVAEVAAALAAEGVLVEDAREPGRFVLGRAPATIDLAGVARRMLASEYPGEFPDEGSAPPADAGTPGAQMAAAWNAAFGAFRGATLAD